MLPGLRRLTANRHGLLKVTINRIRIPMWYEVWLIVFYREIMEKFVRLRFFCGSLDTI